VVSDLDGAGSTRDDPVLRRYVQLGERAELGLLDLFVVSGEVTRYPRR
jgi:hypothetical protein